MPSPTYTDEEWIDLVEQIRLLASISLKREIGTWETLEIVNTQLRTKLFEELMVHPSNG